MKRTIILVLGLLLLSSLVLAADVSVDSSDILYTYSVLVDTQYPSPVINEAYSSTGYVRPGEYWQKCFYVNPTGFEWTWQCFSGFAGITGDTYFFKITEQIGTRVDYYELWGVTSFGFHVLLDYYTTSVTVSRSWAEQL